MPSKAAVDNRILRELGDGLVMRRATAADTESLAEFNAAVHGRDEPSEFIRAWTLELMSGRHPTVGPSDFTLVEDTQTDKIVSSLNLISQRWTYGGLEFGVGQVELVGTHPDYRGSGLVRAQFDEVHQWSRKRGEQATIVAGIPWFYRQFGYETALESGGSRAGYEANVPRMKEKGPEPYRMRSAVKGDMPLITELHHNAAERYLVSSVMSERDWQYLLFQRKDMKRTIGIIVETSDGEPLGFLRHWAELDHGRLWVEELELRHGVPWTPVVPTLLRYLQDTGRKYSQRDEARSFGEFSLWLGATHPASHALQDRLPQQVRSSAWYIRVPDIPDFLRQVATVFENRLSGSFAANYTRELKISFATGGVRLSFEDGRLAESEPWGPTKENGWEDSGRDALFPDLTFLHLLFGHRSVDDLEYAFADCRGGSGETSGPTS